MHLGVGVFVISQIPGVYSNVYGEFTWLTCRALKHPQARALKMLK